MENKIIVSPSILSSDFANLQTEVEDVVKNGAQWIHIDVMDGHFVPNITIGAPVVKSLRKVTGSFLDIHLMIENPEKYIDDFIQAGANLITFHVEAEKNIDKCIGMIKNAKIMAGISIKPNTPVCEIESYLDKIDLVLVMTVEPGFSGQSFIEKASDKILEIKKYAPYLKYIQVDGGINQKTGKICKQKGANCLVAGNFIFKSDNRKNAINSLLY